jgi:tetratricopeptide (TPR) repeat protein
MSSLYPRWGGSHEEMANFAKKLLEFAHLNPRLWTFQGDVDADRGDNYIFDKNYSAALESYTAALQFGDRVSWLDDRGNCYNRLGQKDKAIADYSRAIYYDPTDERAVKMLEWFRKN